MKVKIQYWERHERVIEMTEEEYYKARANTSTRPDLFPEESFNREIEEVNEHPWADSLEWG